MTPPEDARLEPPPGSPAGTREPAAGASPGRTEQREASPPEATVSEAASAQAREADRVSSFAASGGTDEPQATPRRGGAGGHDPRALEVVDWRRTGLAVGGVFVLCAVAVAAVVLSRRKPPRVAPTPSRVGVRVVELRERAVRPEIVAYARARPSRYAIVSARVGGEAVRVHPRLEGGATLPAGTAVIELDDADYRVEAQRLTALADAAKAEVDRLRAQIASIHSRVDVARRLRDLEGEQLQRIREQHGEGVRTDRELDTARISALRAEDALLALEATRDQLGPQLAAARARLAEARARQRRAELDLERTRIRLPFGGQISHVQIEQHQLVKAGQELFVVSDDRRMELPAPLSLGDALLLGGGAGTPPQGSPEEAEEISVEAEADGVTYRWSGRLVRFEPVDGDTQTVRAVVEVENHAGRMPLLNEVFCRVRLRPAAPLRGLLLPEEALQERGMVYVVRDGRLAIATPRIGRRAAGWVLVEEGLESGEQVVVSPLERVVEGTPLAVVEVVEPEETP